MANSETADLMSVGRHCAVPDCQQVHHRVGGAGGRGAWLGCKALHCRTHLAAHGGQQPSGHPLSWSIQGLSLLLPVFPLQIDFLPFKCGSCGKVYW